jgi:hypothetical protein
MKIRNTLADTPHSSPRKPTTASSGCWRSGAVAVPGSATITTGSKDCSGATAAGTAWSSCAAKATAAPTSTSSAEAGKKHVCDLPYLSVSKIETAVERHFATVRLSDSFCASVRRQLDDALLLEHRTMSALKKRLGARLDELDTREDGLLDLVGDPAWPRAKIKDKLAGIERERGEIQAQLADTSSKLETGRQFFVAALDLLADPQGFYQRGSGTVKRAMTKVIFSNCMWTLNRSPGTN